MYKLQTHTTSVLLGGMNRLNKIVREARVKAGLSQAQLAIRLGMTSDNYNKLETGKRGFSLNMLQKLSGVAELNLSFDDLKAWKAADEYGFEILEKAVALRREKEGPKK